MLIPLIASHFDLRVLLSRISVLSPERGVLFWSDQLVVESIAPTDRVNVRRPIVHPLVFFDSVKSNP